MNARRVLRGTAIVLAALALLAAACTWIGASMGLFSGKRPAGLGFDGTRFRAEASWKPNWVGSTKSQLRSITSSQVFVVMAAAMRLSSRKSSIRSMRSTRCVAFEHQHPPHHWSLSSLKTSPHSKSTAKVTKWHGPKVCEATIP